jgi:hypothetical protein
LRDSSVRPTPRTRLTLPLLLGDITAMESTLR